jgi:hypothetical protein
LIARALQEFRQLWQQRKERYGSPRCASRQL